MSHKGNVQLTIIITATPDLVEEGDRIFKSHASWMADTHHREGEKALLRYNLVKGPELSNPLDPGSKSTGNTSYVLMEVYASEAGVADHWRKGAETWKDFPALGEWAGKCQVTALHGSPVIHSLW
ncbi:MAG: hypothetical protein WD423_10150 [Rhodothermales bacterium]